MTAHTGSIRVSAASRRRWPRPLAVLIALTVVVTLAGPVFHPAVARAATGGGEGDAGRDGLSLSCREVAARLDGFLADLQRRLAPGKGGRDRRYSRPPDLRDLAACRLVPASPGGRGDPAPGNGATPAPPQGRSPVPEDPDRRADLPANPSRPPGGGVPGAPEPAPRTWFGTLSSSASGLDPLIVAAVLVLVLAGMTRLVVHAGGTHGARHEKLRRVDRLTVATAAVLRHAVLPRLTTRGHAPGRRMSPQARSIAADVLERAGWTAGQQFLAVALATGSAARAVDLPWTSVLTTAAVAAMASAGMTAIQYLSNRTDLDFWPDLLVRLAKTFLASLAGSLAGDAFGVLALDWRDAVGLAAVATLGAAAKGLLARHSATGAAATPSTLSTRTYTTAVTSRVVYRPWTSAPGADPGSRSEAQFGQVG
jgi:hypothetical protein